MHKCRRSGEVQFVRTHELTIVRDVLKIRRRIVAQPPGWALTAEGLRSLWGQASMVLSDGAATGVSALPADGLGRHEAGEGESVPAGQSDIDYTAIDAVLARSQATIEQAKTPGPARTPEKHPLVYDLDWDEDGRLDQWREVIRQAQDLPAVLQAMVALDAWGAISVLQHAPWLGRLLAASILRQAGVTSGTHLAAINLGLKTIALDRRRHRNRDIRLLAIAQGLTAATEIGLKEHDRLLLAKAMMDRKLQGRRAWSKLPELVDLVMAKPLVSAGMVAKTLEVTPQAALRIVLELGLREMTGRGAGAGANLSTSMISSEPSAVG